MIFSPNPQHIICPRCCTHNTVQLSRVVVQCSLLGNLSGSEQEGRERESVRRKTVRKCCTTRRQVLYVSSYTHYFFVLHADVLLCCFVNIFNTYLMRCYVVASCLNRSINMKRNKKESVERSEEVRAMRTMWSKRCERWTWRNEN